MLFHPVIVPEIDAISDHSTEAGVLYNSPAPVVYGTEPFAWSLSISQPGMEIDPASGIITWPNPIVSGSPHRVVIQATNNAGSDTEEWYLTVTSTPDPPVINDIPDHSIEEDRRIPARHLM